MMKFTKLLTIGCICALAGTLTACVAPCKNQPAAHAKIVGNANNPTLAGTVEFFESGDGTRVVAKIENLPHDGFFAFHVHAKALDLNDPGDFLSTGGHFNPTNADHPNHAGDLPVLLANGGKVCAQFRTNRFKPADIIGCSVILHNDPDDFRSQPAGNAGARIAYGNVVAE